MGMEKSYISLQKVNPSQTIRFLDRQTPPEIYAFDCETRKDLHHPLTANCGWTKWDRAAETSSTDQIRQELRFGRHQLRHRILRTTRSRRADSPGGHGTTGVLLGSRDRTQRDDLLPYDAIPEWENTCLSEV
jgi:hypothetical protein